MQNRGSGQELGPSLLLHYMCNLSASLAKPEEKVQVFAVPMVWREHENVAWKNNKWNVTGILLVSKKRYISNDWCGAILIAISHFAEKLWSIYAHPLSFWCSFDLQLYLVNWSQLIPRTVFSFINDPILVKCSCFYVQGFLFVDQWQQWVFKLYLTFANARKIVN